MLNIDFTFVWVAFNLLVLYLFLKRFLFKRVGTFMEERQRSIAQEIQRGKDLVEEGEAIRNDRQRELDQLRDDRKAVMDESREKALLEADRIIEDAKKEAARMLVRAGEDIERERQSMIRSLRDEVVSLALSAASKVIEANMDTDRNKKLVLEFIDKEDVA